MHHLLEVKRCQQIQMDFANGWQEVLLNVAPSSGFVFNRTRTSLCALQSAGYN